MINKLWQCRLVMILHIFLVFKPPFFKNTFTFSLEFVHSCEVELYHGTCDVTVNYSYDSKKT